MDLTQALNLPPGKGVTAIVGGGGKTSLMFRLAAEYAHRGQPVIVTTTTRIGDPAIAEARLIEAGSPEAQGPLTRPGEVVCVGRRGEPGKLHFPGLLLWERCLGEARRVFAEGDGSKMLPVKAPAGHEPCIPPEADTVIAVAGLSALGQPLSEICFRCELVCALLSVPPETLLRPALLARLLTSPLGQFKDVGDAARFRIFLNQADDARLTQLGLETAALAREVLPGCRVAVGCLRPQVIVRAVV